MILIAAGAMIALAGCASEYKQDAANEKKAKEMETQPVNCATAQQDIATLQKEKVTTANAAAAGVSAVAPIGLVGGLVTGTEGIKSQIATGEYDKILDQAITRIKTTCNIK